jgi:hypothetical protein
MASGKGKLFKYGSIGCGAIVLLGLILFGGLTFSVFRGYEKALESREVLDENYETQDGFTPGVILSEERLRRFVDVRWAVFPFCEKATTHQQAFAKMKAYAEMEHPPAGAMLRDSGRAFLGVFRIGTDFGDYILARNRALLANEMGLGEYSWIYVVAYQAWLGERSLRMLEQAEGAGVFQDRLFPQIREMMARRVAAGSSSPESEDELAIWRAELDRMAADGERVPFEDGLPAGLRDALVPFRDELQLLSCVATGELDVVITEKSGIGYDHH